MITSAYIHIPFCNSLCHYCDFCKIKYDEKKVDEYLDVLEKEIKKNYKGEVLKTIYIGGGTPSSLSLNQLEKLFEIIDLFERKNAEITFEINCESIDLKKLKFLKKKVNRLSFGVQTFDDELLRYLGRNHSSEMAIEKIKEAFLIGFDNISVDLIYGIKNQTTQGLKKDLDIIKDLRIPHVSTYSLMLKKGTNFFESENYIEEDLEFEMYNLVCSELSEYSHYEISNFGKKNYFSKHNLVYWNNEQYYGFGMGASGYVGDVRYKNSENFIDYVNGLRDEEVLSLNEVIQNEFILGLRKTEGISLEKFEKKFNFSFLKLDFIKELIEEGKLIFENDHLKIPDKYLYISNDILVNFMVDYEQS